MFAVTLLMRKDIAAEYNGAKVLRSVSFSVKDSGKYICREYEIMTISIKNNYNFWIYYQ